MPHCVDEEERNTIPICSILVLRCAEARRKTKM